MLHFSAQNFDVEALIASLGLEIEAEQVHIQGTLTLSGKRIWNSSGFSIEAGEGEFDEFERQVANTLIFLKQHHADLQKLGEKSGEFENGSFYLDFGIWTKMFNQITQTNRFPAELIRLAGRVGLGIHLSQYPNPAELEDDDESDE